MSDLLTKAQPALEFLPPNFTPWVWRLAQLALPTWIQVRTNLADIQAENVEQLAELFQEFQAQKTRFLIAFRHPNPEDSYALGYLLWQILPQVAKQQGLPLRSPTHAHFIYDRGIPIWAGDFVSWVYQRLGGTPIQRGKLDRAGLKSARDLFVNGRFPLAAAPEGGNNGHNEIVSPLEPGIAQFGFWCAEDLQKADRAERVVIVPLGIQYSYLSPPWPGIRQQLAQLEADFGLTEPYRSAIAPPEGTVAGITAAELADLYQRLFGLGETLLGIMEQFYRDYYHQPLPMPTATDANDLLAQRLGNLLEAALTVAESYFNMQPKGSVIDRCRRLEQAGWDRIYRTDIKSRETLPPVEKGLVDRMAEEASLRMWHMRLVESFVAVTGRYVREKPSGDRFAETLMLLRDVVTRIKGDNPFPRPSLGKQRVQLTVGTPISVSDRWPDYKASRRQAVDTLTQDLQAALESLIQ